MRCTVIMLMVCVFARLTQAEQPKSKEPTPEQLQEATRAFARVGARLDSDRDSQSIRVFKFLAPITDANLKGLSDLRFDFGMDLSGTQVTDAGLKELKELKHLTSLNLRDTWIADAGLKELKDLNQLTTMFLSNSYVTAAGMNELKHLTTLYLCGDTPVRNVWRQELKELQELKQLNTLCLRGQRATDSWLKELNDVKQITKLDVAGSQITDIGLKELRGLKQLTTLNLDHNQLTDWALFTLSDIGLLHASNRQPAGMAIGPRNPRKFTRWTLLARR